MLKTFFLLVIGVEEGWLLTGEMVDLINSRVKYSLPTAVCVSTNHVTGRGMIKSSSSYDEDADIVAMNYDLVQAM